MYPHRLVPHHRISTDPGRRGRRHRARRRVIIIHDCEEDMEVTKSEGVRTKESKTDGVSRAPISRDHTNNVTIMRRTTISKFTCHFGCNAGEHGFRILHAPLGLFTREMSMFLTLLAWIPDFPSVCSIQLLLLKTAYLEDYDTQESPSMALLNRHNQACSYKSWFLFVPRIALCAILSLSSVVGVE
jgi:hypothetical protein